MERRFEKMRDKMTDSFEVMVKEHGKAIFN
jgi:hypothetical protein